MPVPKSLFGTKLRRGSKTLDVIARGGCLHQFDCEQAKPNCSHIIDPVRAQVIRSWTTVMINLVGKLIADRVRQSVVFPGIVCSGDYVFGRGVGVINAIAASSSSVGQEVSAEAADQHAIV